MCDKKNQIANAVSNIDTLYLVSISSWIKDNTYAKNHIEPNQKSKLET